MLSLPLFFFFFSENCIGILKLSSMSSGKFSLVTIPTRTFPYYFFRLPSESIPQYLGSLDLGLNPREQFFIKICFEKGNANQNQFRKLFLLANFQAFLLGKLSLFSKFNPIKNIIFWAFRIRAPPVLQSQALLTQQSPLSLVSHRCPRVQGSAFLKLTKKKKTFKDNTINCQLQICYFSPSHRRIFFSQSRSSTF